MSVPDELVQEAAEALDADDAPAWWWGEGPLQDAGVDSTLAASIALQAAFAKLGECEAANAVVAARLSNLVVNERCTCGAVAGQQHTTVCVVGNALAALAREFGGQR